MSKRASARAARSVTLVAIVAALVVVFVPTIASSAPSHDQDGAHWGVITRNTIGSPVGDLRNGPFGSFGATGPLAAPPYGDGSLGLELADRSTSQGAPQEKVAYGNEVDFYGNNFLAINRLGFHVFQTGENVGYGGPRNMPNITFEMDANLTHPLCLTDNYTSLVWNPPASSHVNTWSGYIDATTTGDWYFTGNEGICTGCNQATTCTFTQVKTALNDGPPAPFIYTLAIGKGRDSMWIGAVDGLRYNSTVYDFELDGVFARHCGSRVDNNCA